MRHVRPNAFAPDPRDLVGAQGRGCRSGSWMRRHVSFIACDLALVIDIVFLVVVRPERRRFLISAALTAIVAWGRALHARQGLVVCFRRSLLIPD